jgi:hypothetical protein
MLRRKVSDDGQLELFLVVGLVHEEHPQQKKRQAQHRIQHPHQPPQHSWQNCRENGEHEIQCKQDQAQKNRLKRMKSHEAVAFVRINRKEEDPADEPDEVTEPRRNVGF